MNTTYGTYDHIREIDTAPNNDGYFCRNTAGECAYRFVEYNRNDTRKTYPFLTKRVITAFGNQCYTYWKTENATQVKETSGIVDTLNFKISNGSVNDIITIPRQSVSENGTTYIYRGAKNTRCSQGCIWMWAFKYVGASTQPTFYQCAIRISDVSNTNNSTQIVSDDVVVLAASSIALQGTSENEQFQFYAHG